MEPSIRSIPPDDDDDDDDDDGDDDDDDGYIDCVVIHLFTDC